MRGLSHCVRLELLGLQLADRYLEFLRTLALLKVFFTFVRIRRLLQLLAWVLRLFFALWLLCGLYQLVAAIAPGFFTQIYCCCANILLLLGTRRGNCV